MFALLLFHSNSYITGETEIQHHLTGYKTDLNITTQQLQKTIMNN